MSMRVGTSISDTGIGPVLVLEMEKKLEYSMHSKFSEGRLACIMSTVVSLQFGGTSRTR
jgi:hypothetical protein